MPNYEEKLSLPYLLIYSRILLGIIIPIILCLGIPKASIISAILLIVGLLTDVFDGILARKIGISSEKLRIWDSNVDRFFWLMIIGTVFYLKFEAISILLIPIGIIVILEAMAYVISYHKFKQAIATHSLLAKLWTISLLIWIVELILNQSNHSFPICFWLGLISRVEIICIITTLKKCTCLLYTSPSPRD